MKTPVDSWGEFDDQAWSMFVSFLRQWRISTGNKREQATAQLESLIDEPDDATMGQW